MKRRGATLIEVLVAVFVTAIGLLALLALFPVGAVSMAKAIQNNRASQAGANAAAIASFQDLRHDQTVIGSNAANFTNPDTTALTTSANPNGPSYPLLADPVGNADALSKWVGGSPGILRANTSFAGSLAGALKWCCLLDDITFGSNGLPSGGTVEREELYSWSWLLRRPATNSDQTNVTILVFYRRSVGGFAGNAETIYSASGAKGSNTITITQAAGQDKPALRPGRWLLDNSAESTATGIQQNGPVHAFFYRAVSNTDTGASTIHVEAQQPLRADVSSIVVFDGLIEVFDKGY